MILLGRDLSPFVRRSATVLGLLGLNFERRIVAAAEDRELIRQHNPLGRVPALLLDDEVVIDSAAIIDHALESAGPTQQLLAPAGAARRRTLRLSALATGAMEKTVTGAYERTQKGAEFVDEAYRTRVLAQAVDGLAEIDRELGAQPWLGADQPDLADVNAVVAWDFLGIIDPAVRSDANLSALAALSQRANQLEAFAATRWQG